MTHYADVIRIGRFRMVRLPPDLEFEADRVEVRRLGQNLMLSPAPDLPEGPIASAVGRFTVVETPRDRNDPVPARRWEAANDRHPAFGQLRLAA